MCSFMNHVIYAIYVMCLTHGIYVTHATHATYKIYVNHTIHVWSQTNRHHCNWIRLA